MDNFEKIHRNKSAKSKNFYMVLGVCVIAIIAASWATYDSFDRHSKLKSNIISTEDSNQINNLSQDVNMNVDGIDEVDEAIDGADVQKAPKAIGVNAEKSGDQDVLIVYPCSKEIIKDYSNEDPVYSKTLKDWRAHCGTDFAAEQGSSIKSITNGIVKDIYEDSLLGKTIVIDHNNGLTAYYSGFGDTVLVNKDDQIEAGKEIGSINDIPSEALDGYHLHLSIKKDNKYINPMDVLSKAQ